MARMINDHSFWAGGKGKGSVMPDGVHVKTMDSESGAGHMMDYEDTEAKIRSQQAHNVSKAKAHPQKPGYRH